MGPGVTEHRSSPRQATLTIASLALGGAARFDDRGWCRRRCQTDFLSGGLLTDGRLSSRYREPGRKVMSIKACPLESNRLYGMVGIDL